MKRWIAMLLVFAMTMMSMAAFAEGKTLTWARGYESTSLDPAESSDDESNNIVAYITVSVMR